MNKAIYLCAAAALALASCSNDETVEMAKGQGISFRTVAGLNTRGAETTQANLVSIFVNAYEGATGNVFFPTTTFTRENQTNTFVSNPEYFWPKDGTTLHFLALSPAAGDWQAATNNLSFEGGDVKAEFTDITPDAKVENQKDLLIGKASGTANTDGNGLDLQLNHVLSQIQVQAKNSNTGYVYEIKGVRIASVVSKGSYSYPTTGWTVGTDKTTYDVILDQAITLDGTDQNAKNVMKQLANNVSDNAMLIPQQLTAWAGDQANSGDTFDDGSYISLLLNVKRAGATDYIYPASSTDAAKTYGWAAVPVNTEWEAGHKYIYTLDLSKGAGKVDPVEPNPDPDQPTVDPGKDDPDKGEQIFGDPIKFDVEVKEWVENNNTIDM